jgi:glycosyltransferase involved in cell wall biosynthesis
VTALRIAYVIATTTGGTGRHVAMLAEGCAAHGMTVAVFGPEATRQAFPAVGFAPVEIGNRPRPLRDMAAVRRVRALAADFAPDVVHAHGLRAGAAAALALRRMDPAHRPALQVTVHNAAPAAAPSRAVYKTLERRVARHADAVLCVSSDLAFRMRRAGARQVALALVVAPPADPPSAEEIAKVRAEIDAQGRPVLLAAGRLARQKGFDVLLEALIGLRSRDPEPVLVLAGDGPMAGPLASLCREADLSVRLLRQRADIPALLGAADAVVVPSIWEGQPLIVQEALRAGRPIVASRVGGIPELTGEDAALLIRPGDPYALGAAIAAVLGDPSVAESLAAAARARARILPSPADAVRAAMASYTGLAAGRDPGHGSAGQNRAAP